MPLSKQGPALPALAPVLLQWDASDLLNYGSTEQGRFDDDKWGCKKPTCMRTTSAEAHHLQHALTLKMYPHRAH